METPVKSRVEAPAIAGTGLATWYVAMTLPGSEAAVAAGLEQLGYRTYLPQLPGGECLLPRYVFLSPGARWQPLAPALTLAGVTRILRRGTHPLPLSEAAMEQLKQLEAPDFFAQKPAARVAALLQFLSLER